MVNAGVTPAQALLAATRNAAENLDVLHRTGTLEAGKDADIIAVKGNPAKDIGCVADVEFVAHGGRVYRNELEASG